MNDITDPSTIRVDGGIVFWNLADMSARSALEIVLNAYSLEELLPEPMTKAAALKAALEKQYSEARMMVRPLESKDGFTVVKEERGHNENSYTNLVRASVVNDSYLKVTPSDNEGAITRDWNTFCGLLPRASVAKCLVRVLEKMGATCLRPTGGFYWLPPDAVERWTRLAKEIECTAASTREHKIYTIRHRMDENAMRAVQDAITSEVMNSAAAISKEISEGELGDRALKQGKTVAQQMYAKVAEYEVILGCSLAGLKAASDDLALAAAQACLQQSEAA